VLPNYFFFELFEIILKIILRGTWLCGVGAAWAWAARGTIW
jgi:hypothetical protein